MKSVRLATLVAAVVAVVSCAPAGPPPHDGRGRDPAVHVANRPPLAKDVIEAVLWSAGVPLSVSPTCRNAGTEPSDATIGRYLAGFMAEMSAPNLGNAVQTSVEPGRSAAGEPVWICNLTLRHADGDDVWSWGVRFHVREKDGEVLPDSFTCTGAG